MDRQRKTEFILRLKSIIKKCRSKGLFEIAIKIKNKYKDKK